MKTATKAMAAIAALVVIGGASVRGQKGFNATTHNSDFMDITKGHIIGDTWRDKAGGTVTWYANDGAAKLLYITPPFDSALKTVVDRQTDLNCPHAAIASKFNLSPAERAKSGLAYHYWVHFRIDNGLNNAPGDGVTPYDTNVPLRDFRDFAVIEKHLCPSNPSKIEIYSFSRFDD